jgi:hypothetical protein
MSGSVDDDRFQAWLMEMDNAIAGFIESQGSSAREKLDGTTDSLDALENMVLCKYGKPSDMRTSTEVGFVDGASRYVGELFRVATESRWRIDFSDPKVLYYGRPVLQGGKLQIPLCPAALLTTAADRRTGSFLTTVLRKVAGKALTKQ